MPVAIEVIDDQGLLPSHDQTLLQDLCQEALKELQLLDSQMDLSLTILDNSSIQAINRDQRQIDAPTDVLSFPMYDSLDLEAMQAEPSHLYLGDLVISIDQAQAQAQAYGHSFQRELGFLTLHGFLHLLGFDHQTDQEEAVMFQLQKQVMENYGLTRDL